MNLLNIKIVECGRMFLHRLMDPRRKIEIFELRCEDRGFKVGDILALCDCKKKEYSNYVIVQIEYINLTSKYTLDNRVILGMSRLSNIIHGDKQLYSILKKEENHKKMYMEDINILECKTSDIECISLGFKTFELRHNDRDYKVGDILMLCDFQEGKYNKRFIIVKVTYVLSELIGLCHGYIIMGISPISDLTSDDIYLYKRLKDAEGL